MKLVLIGLLISGTALPGLAQTSRSAVPQHPVVGDSAGRNPSPAVRPMGTGFYHRPGDPPTVMRATLDNMPIRTPSPLQEYTMLNSSLPGPRRNNNFYRFELPVPDSLRLKFRRGR